VLMVAAALRGVGLAWINEWSAETLLAEGRLQSVLDDWSPRFPGLCLYYPPHRHVSAGLRAFVTLIRELKMGARVARSRVESGGPIRKKRTLRRR
jgi:DNA-binding transcriptional LysR family regulator